MDKTEAEILKAAERVYEAERRLKQARSAFRSALREANRAGVSQARLARLLGVSRTRIAQLLAEP